MTVEGQELPWPGVSGGPCPARRRRGGHRDGAPQIAGAQSGVEAVQAKRSPNASRPI